MASVAEPTSARSWKETATRVLTDRGAPMHYRELNEELRRLGVAFGGQNPPASFLAVLARDEDFVRVGRGEYWLASLGAVGPVVAAQAKTSPRRLRAKVRRVRARSSV